MHFKEFDVSDDYLCGLDYRHISPSSYSWESTAPYTKFTYIYFLRSPVVLK